MIKATEVSSYMRINNIEYEVALHSLYKYSNIYNYYFMYF